MYECGTFNSSIYRRIKLMQQYLLVSVKKGFYIDFFFFFDQYIEFFIESNLKIKVLLSYLLFIHIFCLYCQILNLN